MKNCISNCRAASVWAVLSAGIGKYSKVEMWYAVLAAYVIDRIGSGVLVELDGVVWASP